jgi:hypothetical protein
MSTTVKHNDAYAETLKTGFGHPQRAKFDVKLERDFGSSPMSGYQVTHNYNAMLKEVKDCKSKLRLCMQYDEQLTGMVAKGLTDTDKLVCKKMEGSLLVEGIDPKCEVMLYDDQDSVAAGGVKIEPIPNASKDDVHVTPIPNATGPAKAEWISDDSVDASLGEDVLEA